MIYEIAGGIEKGIHYTRILEKDDEDVDKNLKEEVVKSHGKTDDKKFDI